MPKRAATPPPGDDEPQYLTICHPYPPQANLELHGDRLALVRWLACCMGQEDLYAFFHKPSAANMVIIEVRRDHPGFRKLLGAHKWSEFVKVPGKHSAQVTRIYFSTFSNGRAVEKAGWKRVFVEDEWFDDFNPNNKYITYPYPQSSYCELPLETQTEFTLCRPIPRELFDILVVTEASVPVGSANWIAYKESQPLVVQITQPCSATDHMPGGGKSYVVLNRTEPSVGDHMQLHSRRPQLEMPTSPATLPAPGTTETTSTSNSCHTGLIEPTCPPHHEKNSPLAQDHEDHDNGEDNRLEDEFGTLPLPYAAPPDGTPLCPSHGTACTKGVCRDHADLLKKMEREKNKGTNEGQSTAWKDASFLFRTRARGAWRARGGSRGNLGSSRGSRGARGTTLPGSSKQ